LQSLANHMKEINGKLPAGSNVTVEFPYNGLGVADNGGYTKDKLFMKAQELQQEFFFLSHTYSHPCTLDYATYEFAYNDLSKNIPVAERLFSDGTASAHFSPASLVNPCITGLFNGDVLRAMKANGIIYAVGDNSVPELQSPDPYHIIETTVATHGEAGLFIIPRHATDIYYDVSNPEQCADEYNIYYGTTYSYTEVMNIQVQLMIDHLLSYRHDPTMFHQINARSFDLNGRDVSHVGMWIEGVSLGISSYYTLPVLSIKQDDLAKVWRQRTGMDDAGFFVTLQVSDGSINGIVTTSNFDCIGSISGIELNPSSTLRKEIYGTEVTYFVTQAGAATQSYTLTNPIRL